jgi:hypothetical protein
MYGMWCRSRKCQVLQWFVKQDFLFMGLNLLCGCFDEVKRHAVFK